MEEQGSRGDPICVSTLSSHCSGPFKCNSIQHGVEVTVCRRYSAPQPFTKLIRIVHMRVSWYTASKPCDTDWESKAANSWLLNIFRLQPVIKRLFNLPYLWIRYERKQSRYCEWYFFRLDKRFFFYSSLKWEILIIPRVVMKKKKTPCSKTPWRKPISENAVKNNSFIRTLWKKIISVNAVKKKIVY